VTDSLPAAGDAPLFLIGFMASGKTTVGRLVAARKGWAFRDLDQLIAAAAGRSVAQIFADPAEGEAGFRRREEAAVREAAALRRTVIATGGGAACVEENLTRMLESGRVVALSVSADEAVKRVGSDSSRPLLSRATDPRATAAELLAARTAFYDRAHHRIDTAGKRPEVVAEEVIRLLDAEPLT
jgi:shikimate kinase